MATFMSEPSDPITVTGGIVSAFVAHNSLPSAELPDLIQSVHAALVKIVSEAVTPNAPEPAAAAISVRKSITPDYLVCLDVVRGCAFQPAIASGVNHIVRLPRLRRDASYSRQFVTR